MSRTVTEALLDKIDQQDKEIERLKANRADYADRQVALSKQANEIERLRAVVDAAKGVTEYGEVAFMGVNIPFKSFRKLKEALAELEEI